MQLVWNQQNVEFKGLENFKLIEDGALPAANRWENKGVLLQWLQNSESEVLRSHPTATKRVLK